MERQLIKTLIDALQSSALSELEYAKDGETLRLVKGTASPAAARPATTASPAAPAPPLLAPDANTETNVDTAVAAPLYGIVHLCPAPGAPPFVAAGQAVDANQVLCTVEAMKVFTEVRAPRPGTVAAILVGDGEEVEPGQALVRLD